MKVKGKWMKGEKKKGKKKQGNIFEVEEEINQRREGKREKEVTKHLES